MYSGAYKYLYRSNNLGTSVGIFLNANKACFKKIRKSFELDKKEPIKVTSRNRRENFYRYKFFKVLHCRGWNLKRLIKIDYNERKVCIVMWIVCTCDWRNFLTFVKTILFVEHVSRYFKLQRNKLFLIKF